MIKIAALNDESEEESGSEEEVTKEALEQIALQQYAKALELQRKGNSKDATQLLKDLLDTELLCDVKKPAQGEKVSGPLLNLKYLCHKNLGAFLSNSDIDAAIECFYAASELDDTDVTLWHCLGQLCMRAKRYEMALNAFQRGTDRNPQHWPCLDKIVTLLLGLDFKEECISTIHDTLLLDPGYLRGLAYRKHIYTAYPYIREFMEYLNPIYKWDEKDDEPFDSKDGDKLIKEAEVIHEEFIEQQRAKKFKYVLPHLKLQKPINSLTWSSVGNSLVHMHHYLTENYYSHACFIDIIFEKETVEEPMELSEESKKVDDTEKAEENAESDKNTENVSENDNEISDKDKAATDSEKVESDIEMVATETPAEAQLEQKTQKKQPVRRRGSAISSLQQWEWYTKRRSGRKKTNKVDRLNDNIYETLRRMVPIGLAPENSEKKDSKSRETSPDVQDLNKLFSEKNQPEKDAEEYFGTGKENDDVQLFITKYTENKRDIIDILKDYVNILGEKWRVKWPEDLPTIFIECNKCYNNHIDVPSCVGDNDEELIHYAAVNILVEEFLVSEKLNASENKETHSLCVIESIGLILTQKPHAFSEVNCLEYMLRYLWVKLHISLLNKCDEMALDSLYQLSHEFEAMGEHKDTYNLYITNFTIKPAINIREIDGYIVFLERNKKLSTVMDLYDQGNYEDVLSIIIDSFEHCKIIAKKQEEEISLDFAVQLCLILDTYWALGKVNECFKWSLISLHEALKHFFRCTSCSEDYKKWRVAVVKILCCMEHILTTEGLACLDAATQKEISQGLEDLIRIIGHQVETSATEMPFGTIVPWILIYYILQREEDQGRVAVIPEADKSDSDTVPNPLMVLFIGHQQLGNRGWCCHSDGKLLYFILDTVVPRIRSPALAKSSEQLLQFMEQCVYCLYGHPSRKTKVKYFEDHNVTPYSLDWHRAQQLYEIFRPMTLPELEGKVSAITTDTEQLFQRILALLPSECDPQKYVPEVEKFIKGTRVKLPAVPPLLSYKMKDIYFLLGDHYFKKEEVDMAVKFNMLDIVINNDRFESWAQISLAKVTTLERPLKSCKNLNEKEFLTPARSIVRCFQRSLEIDPNHCNMWVEYGMFVYIVHSFCSRALKQASELLSMEDFASLEKQKEDMLDTTHRCFTTADALTANDYDKSYDEIWLYYYMLGKVAEKRNKPPAVYLDFYSKAVDMLQKAGAIYPLKISYSTPMNLSIEVLEMHYRIHASILKYIEQHESKPIPVSVGKVFQTCIEEWRKGPFSRKSAKDRENAALETEKAEKAAATEEPVQAANILKRSVSDAGEESNIDAKRLKLESAAAKVRRSASYDTERIANKEPVKQSTNSEVETAKDTNTPVEITEPTSETSNKEQDKETDIKMLGTESMVTENLEKDKDKTDLGKREESSSSSSSSTGSSSSDSTSDSSTDSSRDSESSNKSNNDSRPLTDEEIMNIVSACLYALEDCACRFPPHYKAIYRLAHYHFYFKKGKDIERCRDLMLLNFTSSFGSSIGGLFSEKKTANFFNNIWKIPVDEVERAGGFAFHMNRCVLLTMEILKEIDDHKTLLELTLQLQKIPEPDKTYLRDCDREELAQQAFSLSVLSLKGQLLKFCQQPDLKTNEFEQQGLKSLMVDIYSAYHKVQKQSNSKQFVNLIVDAYKLITTTPITDNMNLVDLSLKYCQVLKQTSSHDNLLKAQNAQKKQAAKMAAAAAAAETLKTTSQTKANPKVPTNASTSSTAATPATALPKMSQHEMAAAFQNYLPMLNDPVISQQTAAALSLSYLSNALAGYSTLQNTLQNSLQTSLQNSFQAEFYRQFLGQGFSSYIPPAKKQKRGPKPGSRQNTVSSQLKASKTFSAGTSTHKTASTSTNSVPKPTSSVQKTTASLQKSASAPLAPSMGTVLPSLPASMTAGLTTFNPPISTHSMPTQAHMSSASTVSAAIHTKPPMPHQQVSPGKTLQEKLAERQKNMPAMSKNVSTQEINASISRLPSSLTITKTAVAKAPIVQGKKPEVKKSLFNEAEARPKPISSDEVIVLDDD